METKTLAQRIADQARSKARRCFDAMQAHAEVNPASRFVEEYRKEAFHWLRVARAADAGDSTPRPYRGGQ